MTLWIDAVCIDQDMTDSLKVEKNAQVQLMAQIYSKAIKVLVWLGDDEIAMTDTKALLQHCCSRYNIQKLLKIMSDVSDQFPHVAANVASHGYTLVQELESGPNSYGEHEAKDYGFVI